MRLPINLASQPFRRDRAMIVASLTVAVLLVLSLGALIALALSDRSQMGDVRRDVARLNQQILEATKAKAESDSVLRQPANAEVLERSVFLNTLLYRKGISWTRLLADLEKVMPPNVRVLNIRPFISGKNQVTLDLMVGAEGPDAAIALYKALENSPLFSGVFQPSYNPPTQAEPLHRYRFTVNYAQKL
jgi:type IV pilus assembly protein PilN